MGNGQTAEKRDKECHFCEADISKQSYWLSINKGMARSIVEVCPECHHFYTYGTKEQLENYKKRMGIK